LYFSLTNIERSFFLNNKFATLITGCLIFLSTISACAISTNVIEQKSIPSKNSPSVTKGNTTFYFQKQVNNSAVKAYDKGIQAEENDYRQLFGNVHSGKLSVIFYPNASSDDSVDAVGTYYPKDNSIVINLQEKQGNFNQEEVSSVSAHEYNHYLLYQFLHQNHIPSTKVPAWLKEGMARYTENRSTGYDLSEQSLEGYKLIPFEKLESEQDWKSYLGSNNYNAYEQSGVLVAYILKKSGSDSIHNLLIKLKNESFDQAFKETTGQDFKSYAQQYFMNVNTSLPLWKKVDLALKQKKTKQAIALLSHLHQTFPQNSTTLLWEAREYLSEGDYTDATKFGKMAETLNPRGSDINSFLSQLPSHPK
jgi:hypothetical protein